MGPPGGTTTQLFAMGVGPPRISGPDGYGGPGLKAHKIRSRRATRYMEKYGATQLLSR
jgi:hypothetical protein